MTYLKYDSIVVKVLPNDLADVLAQCIVDVLAQFIVD